MMSTVEQTKSWPDLAIGLYDHLNERLLDFLLGFGVGSMELWKIRDLLTASGRHLSVTVNGDRQFLIGA